MAQPEFVQDTAVNPYDSDWERTNELRGGRYDLDPESLFKLRRAMRGLALLRAQRARAAATEDTTPVVPQPDTTPIETPALLPDTVKVSELSGDPMYGETDTGDIVVADPTDLAA